jgi:hypothetical protein
LRERKREKENKSELRGEGERCKSVRKEREKIKV